MTAEILLYHLKELGIVVTLSNDVRGLEIEAPRRVLTPELTELMREFKGDLVDLVYSYDEAEAIAIEGCEGEAARPATLITFEGDPLLGERWRNAPMVRALADELSKRGGGLLEFLRVEEGRAV